MRFLLRADLLQIAKQTFFPDGTNNFGSIDSMACSVANFCGDKMADTTLAQYVEKHKLSSRIRLYLKTMCIEDTEEKNEDLLSPVFDKTSVTTRFESDISLDSTEQRQILLDQQNREYMESLWIDKEKKEKEEEKKQLLKSNMLTFSRQERLQSARMARLPPPCTDQDAVVVAVRHITVGLITHAFRNTERLAAVYDWVGSQSLTPEHFILSSWLKVMKHLPKMTKTMKYLS